MLIHTLQNLFIYTLKLAHLQQRYESWCNVSISKKLLQCQNAKTQTFEPALSPPNPPPLGQSIVLLKSRNTNTPVLFHHKDEL